MRVRGKKKCEHRTSGRREKNNFQNHEHTTVSTGPRALCHSDRFGERQEKREEKIDEKREVKRERERERNDDASVIFGRGVLNTTFFSR